LPAGEGGEPIRTTGEKAWHSCYSVLYKKYFTKYKIIVSDEEKYFYFKLSVKTINMTHCFDRSVSTAFIGILLIP
jgi:hypothetical protein